MQTKTQRRTVAGTAVALLLTTAGLAQGDVWAAAPDTARAGSPTAPERQQDPRKEPLEIVSTDTSLSAPATTTPGPTTFRSSTTHEGSGWVGLARENPDGSSTFLGGAVIHPGKPGLFTQTLSPGEYVLFDYLHTEEGDKPRQQTLKVGGTASGSEPEPTGTVVSKKTAGEGPRFAVDGTLRAGQPFRFRNELPGQYNEAVLFPLGKDVTRARLQKFFDELNEGGSPEAPFDTSAGLGSLPLSTDRSSVVQVPTQRGRHVLVTWVRDSDGQMLAAQGQFEIVEVR